MVLSRFSGGNQPGRCILAWGGNDGAVVDLEQNGPYVSTSWATGTSRTFLCPNNFSAARLFLLTHTNANTIDGANWTLVRNNVEVNQVIVVDQATGDFQDLVNTDVFSNLDELQFRYNQGDNTCGVRSIGVVVLI